MKRVLGLAAFGCTLTGVRCKNWTPAEETLGILPMLGQSPKPTPAPFVAEGSDLERRRAADNTCAYVSGSAETPLYCPATADCVYNEKNSYIGCCDKTATKCPVWTTCYNRAQSDKYTTDNGYTLYCGQSSFPNCIQHLYQDDLFTGYTLWGCALSKGKDEVYYTAKDGPITPTSAPVETTTPATTSEATRTAERAGAASTTAAADDGAGAPVGAIVGGVVGGLAVIGLIGLGAFVIVRSGKNKANPKPQPNAFAPGPGQSPPQGPPPGSSYGPNQAQMDYKPSFAGFPPADPRDSTSKPPMSFDHGSMPGSPAPTYHSVHTPPPPAGYGHQSPSLNPAYPASPHDYHAAQQQQHFHNGAPQGYPFPSPQQGYQTPGYQQGPPGSSHGQPPNSYAFAAELPATKDDGQVRELAG